MQFPVPVWLVVASIALTTASRAEIQSQHIADTSLKIGPVEPLWHIRVRTAPEGGGVSQIRIGPTLTTDLHDRVAVIAGYYYVRTKEDAWTTLHRPFGGVELVLWKRRLEVDARTLLERHISKSEADYNVLRHRFRFTPDAQTAPYAGVEAFADRHGLQSMRYSFGLRRTIANDLIVDFAYFFENRHPRAGSDRHMLTTTIHWRNRNKRIDTDP